MNIQLFYQKIKFKFEFKPGQMIFDKVMPLENTVQKEKKSVPLNMAFEILSPSGEFVA